jgi:hypothetical protein
VLTFFLLPPIGLFQPKRNCSGPIIAQGAPGNPSYRHYPGCVRGRTSARGSEVDEAVTPREHGAGANGITSVCGQAKVENRR